MTASAVSVVVPARDAGRTITAQLEALSEQDARLALEVIVADNGSTDDTVARVRAWSPILPGLRIVDASGQPGAAHARNVGVAHASHDILLFCDADDVVDRCWVRELVEALASADVVAGGTVPVRGRARPRAEAPQPFGRAGFGFLPTLIGASFGARRAAWDAVGGFDSSLPTCEDLDFAWRAQLAGLELVQAPQAFVFHREPASARGVLRQWYRYGRWQPSLHRRFARDGLRSEPARRVAVAYARLLLATPSILVSARERRVWCRELGRRAGRAVGSFFARTVYL